MKLMWFHLMPYTELPDDFREKHPSVWVDIHSSLFDPRRAHHMYNDFMDELEYAAQCGFDAVCVNEHHNNAGGRSRCRRPNVPPSPRSSRRRSRRSRRLCTPTPTLPRQRGRERTIALARTASPVAC
jgi:hypothetical protein